MAQRFVDKVVLVTGGGSGIGRATALAFAREGATVAVAGRSVRRLEETVAAIEHAGGRAGAVVADVTRPADVAGLIDTVVERHGRLDIAFNNAGALEAGPLADMDDDAWQRLLDVNVTGVYLSMKHEIRHMRANGGGVIVNAASNIGAHLRLPHMGAYAAAKAAVSALTRAAAREWIRAGIRINAVSPGPIDTPMSLLAGESEEERALRLRDAVPAGRVGSRAEAAAAVLYLASDEAGYVVGHDLVIDGGGSA